MNTHRYYDISHFRAPYKNSVLAGYGQEPGAETAAPVLRVPTIEELQTIATKVTTSAQAQEIRKTLEQLLGQAQSSEQAQAIQNAIAKVRSEEERRIAAEVVKKAAPWAALVTVGLIVVAGAVVYGAVSKRGW